VSTKLLDTDICIDVLRGRTHAVERMAAELVAGELRISAVSAFELVFGAQKSPRARDELAKVRAFLAGGPRIAPFEATDAESAGRLRATLSGRGEMIGAYDLLIAGQGLARDWTVVTATTREFARVDGLRLETWIDRA
jgi:tRNA(fMet)-specific endonuclease VapC